MDIGSLEGDYIKMSSLERALTERYCSPYKKRK